jgi:hypothetical protein
VIDIPISGIRPHRDSMIDRRQSGVEKRISAPSAICRPKEEKGNEVEQSGKASRMIVRARSAKMS